MAGVGSPVSTSRWLCCLEALQNIAKYAEATTARILLRHDGINLAFSVTDDGKGFDRATVSLGSGLTNRADRPAGAGGFVDVVSAPGQGTTVSGGVPVPAWPVHVVAATHASSSSIGPNSDLGM